MAIGAQKQGCNKFVDNTPFLFYLQDNILSLSHRKEFFDTQNHLDNSENSQKNR